jgi:REP element-mobilizing transposase RayT
MLFHVLNRGHARAHSFDDDEDYRAFQRVLTDTLFHVPMRLLASWLMPNHWPLVLGPREARGW